MRVNEDRQINRNGVMSYNRCIVKPNFNSLKTSEVKLSSSFNFSVKTFITSLPT